MLHALSYLFFGLACAGWLRIELEKKFSLRTNIKWLLAAMVFGVIGSLFSYGLGGMLGNLLLHSIGGGMASACIYYYLARSLGFRPNWRLEIACLFLFVSTLGVINEIAEYAIELTFQITMSHDARDTWRDFIANTIGAFTVWLVLRLMALRKQIK